jgi:NADH dehydrogenase
MLCSRAVTSVSGRGERGDELGRVLVTGANGHLGRRLIRRHPQLRAVVRSERAAATLRALPEAERLEIEVLDYRDVDRLTRAATGCRHVVHLTGIIKETRSNRYTDAHEATCEALAKAAAAAGIERVVYLSILGSDPASPNPCLASKGRAERILLDAETPVVILRVPLVLGPGDATTRIVAAEARARVLPLIAGGRAHTQPIYADDVVEAMIAAMTTPGLDDVTLELAGPESLTQRAFVARAAALYGRKPTVIPIPVTLANGLARVAERLLANPPLTRAMLGVLCHDDRVDAEAARKELGIDLTPLDEALRRSIGPEATEA